MEVDEDLVINWLPKIMVLWKFCHLVLHYILRALIPAHPDWVDVNSVGSARVCSVFIMRALGKAVPLLKIEETVRRRRYSDRGVQTGVSPSVVPTVRRI